MSICAGGAGSEAGFQGATGGLRLATLISNLTQLIATYGYDGVDLNWEPMSVADHAPFTNLVRRLRSALDALPSRKLPTAAVGPFPGCGEPPAAQYQMLAGVQSRFDQTQEYLSSAPVAERHPLSQAINEALLAPGRVTVELSSAGATLQFTGMPLGSYRVQWSGDLAAPAWNTLSATNFVGPSGLVSVSDPHGLSAGQRYYRVRSDG